MAATSHDTVFGTAAQYIIGLLRIASRAKQLRQHNLRLALLTYAP
jgi:hypothetical protein